jgi:hypothetical protein
LKESLTADTENAAEQETAEVETPAKATPEKFKKVCVGEKMPDFLL